jgi:radical SAM superfamily enzyme
MNYFLTQYFVNKIKRNSMKEMYDKETLDGVSKINGKQYDEKMIDRIADEMMMREKYMVSQHNEKVVDEWSKRINDTLNRIESKVDRLIDAVVNVK